MSDAFLPRIRCVFYASFDPKQGPLVSCQVPEGSIGSTKPKTPTATPAMTRASTTDELFTLTSTRDRYVVPPFNRKLHSHNTILFDFESVVDYIIPKNQLCNRLVRCNTPMHQIIGFPVILTGDRYDRNQFRYNLCFVFDRKADLSCYEPIVRKCGRVLIACEQESSMLSSPNAVERIHSILEQLYEDLNSYSETSIPIDSFNSIELKIFPFYPNPPKVSEWQVPVALLNLQKRKDPSWDLTMEKVSNYIDGVNHVQRISEKADVSIELTCNCLSHLLFYQCIMMIDIFQFSNMYTLNSNIQWLVEDPSVYEECAVYVIRPEFPLLPFTNLMHLYARLKPGKTIHTWMEENNIVTQGIDPQRFVSFGIIKGFLRRVHRWPVLLLHDKAIRRSRNETTAGGLPESSTSVSTSSTATVTRVVDHISPPSKLSPSLPTTLTYDPITNTVVSTPPNTRPPLSQRPSLPRTISTDPTIEALTPLLKGLKHSDELCVRFGIGWHELERLLMVIGQGGEEPESHSRIKRDGNESDRLGRVRIIFR